MQIAGTDSDCPTCPIGSNVTAQNNLAEDIDNAYNPAVSVAYSSLVSNRFLLFDHNTVLPGMVMPINRGIYGGRPSEDCATFHTIYNTNFSITSNIMLDSGSAIFADCFTGPSPWLSPPAATNTVLTNNLLAGGISGAEQTAWNAIGSANQFPANYSAIGLLVSNKALAPSSTYLATGAGANVLCLDETAVTNGTVASTTCVASTPQTSSVLRGKPILRGVTLR